MRRLASGFTAATVALIASALAAAPVGAETVLDSFEPLQGWTATASQGASVEIAQDAGYDGLGMRIDYDFGEIGGFVLVRKDFDLPLPPNYVFTLQVRAAAIQKNDFEFKLVDPSGRNVWWDRMRDFSFTSEWREMKVRRARIEYAWGPSGGGPAKRIGRIELAISGAAGGKGSVWIDDLIFERREPASRDRSPPTVSASTVMGGHDPKLIFDQDPATSWRSGTLANDQWLLIDFGRQHEYGGLVIDWDAEDYATSYRVEVSDDEQEWTVAYASTNGNGARDYIYLPDGESRYVRLHFEKSSRGQGYAIVGVIVEPFEFSASPNQFLGVVARDSPAGTHPRYLGGRQTYWTIIGVNGDEEEALMNDDGMLEVGKGGFSIEPFLNAGGNLIGWASVDSSASLLDGYLPIPTVTWRAQGLMLSVSAFAAGEPGVSSLYARYRVENQSEEFRHASLFLALRPFQVLPSWQALNMVGGASPIHEISFDGRAALVNRDRTVISLTAPDRFGAVSFEEGPLTSLIAQDKLPPHSDATDAQGFASAAFNYSLELAPGAARDVYLLVPFHPAERGPDLPAVGTDPTGYVADRLRETAEDWRTVLDRVSIALPPGNEKIVETWKSTIAYILINRDGPRLQPGSRTYGRSWIRDGALTSAALLETGFPAQVRDFVRWYAPLQAPDGRVPCCVDQRGPDPVPENDSHGELIYAIAEYYRHTRDVGFLNDLWPHVVGAVEYIDKLRHQRMTDTYARGDKRAYYGLLPESISHEGYSAQPVHSYWDDFFALRGLKDAAAMAIVVGDRERAASFAALRDEFRRDLYASIELAMKQHKIDYIPGSVELGDFDASATAAALVPGEELANLPPEPLRRTFERYYEFVRERSSGKADWSTYTPYEMRNVEALLRLGKREAAFDVLQFMLDSERPAAWNEWAEIIWRDRDSPRFIGDMPHTWVGSTFVRAVRGMIAYERESDDALVVAAGVPLAWVTAEPGMTVKRLPTHYGVLNYTLGAGDPGTLRMSLSGDLAVPRGKVVLRPPLPEPLRAVTVNGRPVEHFAADEVTIDEIPAEVVFRYAAPLEEGSTPSPAADVAVPAGTN